MAALAAASFSSLLFFLAIEDRAVCKGIAQMKNTLGVFIIPDLRHQGNDWPLGHRLLRTARRNPRSNARSVLRRIKRGRGSPKPPPHREEAHGVSVVGVVEASALLAHVLVIQACEIHELKVAGYGSINRFSDINCN